MSNDPQNNIGSLAAKIAKAALEVGGALSPDKRNDEQRYNYISADKILSLCGQALFNHGVIVFPNVTETVMMETPRQGKGPRYDCTVKFAMTLTDGETAFTSVFSGIGSDYLTPDKALYKAVTSGHKYFLMKLLCIGAGNEDSEHDPETEKPAQKKQPAPQPESIVKDVPAHEPESLPAIAPAAPTNGKKPANREALADRYFKLCETAAALGMTPKKYEPRWTDEELTANGKALAAEVKAVESAIPEN